MKTKIFLAFIYFWILSIEIACDKPSKCPKSVFDIVGIESLAIWRIISPDNFTPLDKDSIHADSLIFVVAFEEKVIAKVSDFNLLNTSYATEPCPIPRTDWKLDSVRVFEVINNLDIDVTYNFGFLQMNIDNQNDSFIEKLKDASNYAPAELRFTLLNSPVKKDIHQYKFQFFDNRKRIFEIKSKPILILVK